MFNGFQPCLRNNDIFLGANTTKTLNVINRKDDIKESFSGTLMLVQPVQEL